MKNIVMSLSAILALSSYLSAGTYGNTYNSYDGNFNAGQAQTEIGMVVDVPEIVYEKESENESWFSWSDEGAGFYLSGAYAYTGVTEDIVIDNGVDTFIGGIDETGNGWMVAAGYDFNKYIGIEARYSGVTGISKDAVLTSSNGSTIDNGDAGDMDISNFAGYLKGSFPVTESFSVYGLVGYGVTSWTVADNNYYTAWDSESGFQYGAGVKYSFSENFSIFADYTSLYDDGLSGADSSSSWSVDSSLYTASVGISYKF